MLGGLLSSLFCKLTTDRVTIIHIIKTIIGWKGDHIILPDPAVIGQHTSNGEVIERAELVYHGVILSGDLLAVKVGNVLSAGQWFLWQVVIGAGPAGLHVLPHTSRTDSASTHKISDHAMLTTSGNRWWHNANRQAFNAHKLVVKEQKIFLQFVVAGMNPCVPETRSGGPEKRADAVLVAHRLDLTRDRYAVNGCATNRSPCFFLQLSCQRSRAGSAGLAWFLLERRL